MRALTKSRKKLVVGTGVAVITVALLFLPIVSGRSVVSSLTAASPDPPGYSAVSSGQQGTFALNYSMLEPIWVANLGGGCTDEITLTVTTGSVFVVAYSSSFIGGPGILPSVAVLDRGPHGGLWPIVAGQSFSVALAGAGYQLSVYGVAVTPSAGYYDISGPTCDPSSVAFCDSFSSLTMVAQESNLTQVTITNYGSATVNITSLWDSDLTLITVLSPGETATFGLPFYSESGAEYNLYVQPQPASGLLGGLGSSSGWAFVCTHIEVV